MEKPNRRILKSKSSSNTIKTKIIKDKTLNDSALNVLPETKKKGIYVEKRNFAQKTQVTKGLKTLPNQITRRRDNKQFLNSVLNILSKGTTSTQFPEPAPDKSGEEIIPKKTKVERAKAMNNEKKSKFKSKTLNRNHDDNFIVLKSMNSSKFSSPSLYSDQSRDVCKISSNNVTAIAKEVLEGKKTKRVTIDEPATLVSEHKANDKNLYNFFVDILETTFSACDMKESLETNKLKLSESNLGFEIEESVAKKLVDNNKDVATKINDSNKKIVKPTTNYYDNNFVLEDYLPYKTVFKSDNRKPKVHEKNRLKSTPQSTSNYSRFNKSTKKRMKSDFIDILKRELTNSPLGSVEPQNFYQSLKFIAKTKKANAKLKYADEMRDKNPECVFKRRKIIAKSRKNRRNIVGSTKTLNAVQVA
ncbi:uncharacterized protein LOC114251511 [Bombyx mandarina]|uniref:Uncharacterized protein LOC114251511 n=1 Tax=Bombyx mandarina TaxID=7092 RepID=A0A6J2KJ71_BOMMA|nr:uncharacterized protein LOC114251511 [Bombyx mandarina]